jgi:hypothetical protein
VTTRVVRNCSAERSSLRVFVADSRDFGVGDVDRARSPRRAQHRPPRSRLALEPELEQRCLRHRSIPNTRFRRRDWA